MAEHFPDLSNLTGELAAAEALRFSEKALRIVPMPNGKWAIFHLNHLPPIVFDSLDEEALLELSEATEAYGIRRKARFREAGAFYGEPNDKQLARDLKRERQTFERPLSPEIEDLAIDL